jgi:mono/diheme cytochrome c family protein
MKSFLFGILTIIILLAVVLVFALLGFVNMRADNPPSHLETAIASHAMDASVARAATKLTNPVTADEANLVAGANLYRDHCSLCHGDPAYPKAPLNGSFNPPAPQFMDDKADMPENQNFFILQHGIRWTAMPGWKNVLSDQEIWQLVTFLSHMSDLPPAAKKVFTEPDSQTEPASQTRPASASH